MGRMRGPGGALTKLEATVSTFELALQDTRDGLRAWKRSKSDDDWAKVTESLELAKGTMSRASDADQVSKLEAEVAAAKKK